MEIKDSRQTRLSLPQPTTQTKVGHVKDTESTAQKWNATESQNGKAEISQRQRTAAALCTSLAAITQRRPATEQ